MLLLGIVLFLTGSKAVDLFVPADEITLPQGKIQGQINLKGNYRKFVGIPYATVPHRFQAPGEPPQWEGTFYASRGYPACPQYSEILPSHVLGNEECLGLNIFTPILAKSEKLPVMVFIHGGGWFKGDNDQYIYDPRYLVEKGAIVVTINYRLGALGFLCLENMGAPGNAGIKDQVAALKWVKNYIKYFGGDPNSITLFGQDAGAASINFLMTSPSTSGLFHRAILESGPALVPMAFDRHPIETASSIAADLGFNSTDPDKLLEFYQKVPIDDLVLATHKSSKNNAFAPYVFRPCLEKADEGGMITRTPSEQIVSPTVRPNLEVIIGYNNKDGLILSSKYDYKGYQSILQDFSQIIPGNLKFPNADDKMNFIKEAKSMYFGSEQENGYITGLTNYFSDCCIIYPSVATIESLVKRTNASVYDYYFTYDSVRNLDKKIDGMARVPGADHGDELWYLFKPALLQPLPILPEDAKMIYMMTMMWTRFAVDGNPSIPKDLPVPIEWPKSTSDKLNFIELDDNPKIIPLPNKERMQFWQNAYDKYGPKPLNLGNL